MQDNKEIIFNKSFCVFFSIVYGSLFSLAISLSLYLLYLSIKNFSLSEISSKEIIALGFGLCLAFIFLMLAKSMFTDLWACIRLCGIHISLHKGGLTIRKGSQELIIDREESNVLYCMTGWLIIWPSNMILLRKGFLLWHGKTIIPYFKEKMNYLETTKEKKQLIKSLSINTNNPIRYIKWPDTI